MVYIEPLECDGGETAELRMWPPAPGGETILVIEDEPMLLVLLGEALAREGYVVLKAAGGEEALRVAADHPGPIHLLLTDASLQGLRGWQVAERLQASRPGIKVLYTSGSGYDIVAQQGGPEEVEFLPKPYSLPELERRVRELLDR